MRRLLHTSAFVLCMTLPVAAEAPAVRLTVILTPERVKASNLETLTPVLTVNNRGTIVIAEPNNLFMPNNRTFLFDAPTPVSDCAFTPDGALLVVSGNTLGYHAGGQYHPQITLPENAMRLAVGPEQVYVYGGDCNEACSIYVVEPQRGHAKLCTMPSPIGAAAATGDTLYFAAANEIYRLTPGDEINLICHLPGPAITSITAADEDTLYFIAGQTLYTWQAGRVGIISEGLGDVACWRGGTLYILNVAKQSLIKLENLPGLGAVPQETP